MADSRVSVELSVEEKKALRAITAAAKELDRFEKEAVEAGDALDDSFKKAAKSGKGLESVFNPLTKAVTVGNLAAQAIGIVASTVSDFVSGSVAAAQQQEDSINRLTQALRASGDFSRSTVKDFEAFASSLQDVSVFGDEVILNQVALAKSLGATNAQAKDLVTAAANLSATFGDSLESSVEKLGKALNGNIGRLGQYIPELRSLTKEQLAAGDAAAIINEKFAGAAASQLDTYSGRVQSLKNAYGDLQEELGFAVTRSETYNSIIDISKRIIQELTASIQQNNLLNKAQKDGFVETEQELNKLSERYAKVRDEIERYQQVIDADKNKTLLESLFSFDNAPLAKEKVLQLRQELDNLGKSLDASAEKVDSVLDGGGKTRELTQEQIDALKKRTDAEKLALAELQAARENYDLFLQERELLNREITAENQERELLRLQEFEQRKLDAQFLAQETKNAQIADAELRRLAEEKTAQEKSLAGARAFVQAEDQIGKRRVQLEQQRQAAILGIFGATAQLAGAIAKDGSKEQFLIQKAAAVAQTIVATNLAATQALANPPGPPATIPVAAYAKAQGAINLAAILAQTVKGFETGGIVGGSSFSGDNVLARVNSREGIFTVNQQRELFDIANGRGGANSDMVSEIRALRQDIRSLQLAVNIDGREIARSVRDQREAGFAV